MTRFIIVALVCACLLITAGCGGNTLAIYQNGQASVNTDWRAGSTWDPFAPSLVITSIGQALDQVRWRNVGAWQVTVLDQHNQLAASILDALVLTPAPNELQIKTSRPFGYAGIYVKYDAATEHVTAVSCTAQDWLALSAELQPGIWNVGIVSLDGLVPAGSPLARVSFANGAASCVRRASFSQSAKNAVRDLAVVDNGDETVALGWSERNTGDYDLNSEVSSADLVPIAQHYLEHATVGEANYAVREVIDGDENTEINSADLVPIAQNLGSLIQGYNLYRTELSSATEVPDPADSSRWTKVENTANPSGLSIPRDLPAGQNFRLHYTFRDTCGAGDFGWLVRAAGPGHSAATEGLACPPVTLTVGSIAPPEAALSLEIVPPASSFLSVNDEFYVAVRVANITGLSSVNVRLEYDATLLEFLDGTGEFDAHPNLLSNYLFLAVDDVGTADAPYKLLGFNITQKQGTAAVTGSGIVGYLRFKAIGSGISATAIRFPQATTFLLLWGEQYGVPVATPGLGSPLTVNIG